MLHETVCLPLCRCLKRVGDRLCGRGLSQLCLVLSPACVVDLIIFDSYSCLFHVLLDLDFIIVRIEGIGFCSMFFLLAAGNLNICLHEARYLLLQPNTD